jgi:hypothetical protein
MAESPRLSTSIAMIPRMRSLAAPLLVLVAPSLLYSDEVNDRRAAAGIRFFRALRHADLAQRFVTEDKIRGLSVISEATR